MSLSREISSIRPPCHVGRVREEVVKLSHLISPKEFFVTITSDPYKVKTMQEKINNWSCNIYQHPPSPDAVINDPYVIVFSTNHDKWCRARLRHTSNDTPSFSKKEVPSLFSTQVNVFRKNSVEVQLIDFGGVERVPYSNVRCKYDDVFDFEAYPPLALKCCLHTLIPKNGKQWSANATELMFRFCADKDVWLRVKETDHDLYFVDLIYYDPRGGIVSLRDYLVTMNEAKYWFGGGNLMKGPSKQPRSFTKLPSLEIGKQFHVKVTDIRNPDLYFVNLLEKDKEIIDFHTNLMLYFSLPDKLNSEFVPKKGEPCVVHEDNKYYRGLVLEIISPSSIRVELVDSGEVKKVPPEDLRILPEEFYSFPTQAIRCRLAEIAPSTGFKWSREATDLFRREVYGNKEYCQFMISVSGFDSSGKTLTILRRITRNQTFINAVLIDQGMARPQLLEQISQASDNTEVQYLAELSSSSLKFNETVLTNLNIYNVCGYNILKELVERNKQGYCSKMDSYIKVAVSHKQSPSMFYIQIITPEVLGYFRVYETNLFKEHSSLIKQVPTGELKPLRNGFICLFHYKNETVDSWYRGDILERLEDANISDALTTQYNVRSKDYGFTATIPRRDIRKFPKFSNFLKDDDFCLKCELKNVKPAGGGDWTNSAQDEFEFLLKKFKSSLFLSVDTDLPDIRPDILDVELFGQETKIAHAFAPAKLKNFNLANVLILKGLAIPLKSTALSDDEEDIEVVDDGEVLRQPFSFKSESIISYLREGIKNIDEKIAKQVVFYREAVRPTSESFMARITHVGDNFRVWWRVIEENVNPPIKTINRRIAQVLREQDQLTPLVGEAFIGRAITAYFAYDKSWNRAEIVREEDNGEKLVVLYVDYGNIVTIPRDQASSDVFHLEIPKLAMSGYLTQVVPKSSNLNIEESIQDKLYKLLVDKECLIFWENYLSRTDMKIHILMPDNRDVREELLTSGLVKRDFNEIKDNPSELSDLLEVVDKSDYTVVDPKFELGVCYPVVHASSIIYNYLFVHPLPLLPPLNEIEHKINDRHTVFLQKIQEMRDQADSFKNADDFRVGDPCCARYIDNEWYRGLVIEVVFEREMFKVLYVDYGNTEELEINNLRILPPEFLSVPVHLFPVKLHKTHPARDKTPYVSLKKRMLRILDNHPDSLVMKVKTTKKPWEIELFISDSSDRRVPGRNVFQSLFESRDLIRRAEVEEEDVQVLE